MRVHITIILALILSVTSSYAGSKEAQFAAENSPACKDIKPFYWEIGNQDSVLLQGSSGNRYDRNTTIKIASASKFIFAAYLLEKQNGQLSEKDKMLLLMRGGYEEFNPFPCALRRTVGACFEARSNSQVSRSSINKFFYSGGNAQALAVQHGLASMNRKELAIEIEKTLKNKFSVSYSNLAIAGGAETSAAEFAKFLQEILNGHYLISKFLGKDSVCTLPAKCKTAVFSPAPENWLYSYHHWVELDEKGHIDAYSSPGARGFYPWISQDKNLYGIISRENSKDMAYWQSVLCGREIRRAFMKTAQ